jgi:hypothetical protein
MHTYTNHFEIKFVTIVKNYFFVIKNIIAFIQKNVVVAKNIRSPQTNVSWGFDYKKNRVFAIFKRPRDLESGWFLFVCWFEEDIPRI